MRHAALALPFVGSFHDTSIDFVQSISAACASLRFHVRVTYVVPGSPLPNVSVAISTPSHHRLAFGHTSRLPAPALRQVHLTACAFFLRGMPVPLAAASRRTRRRFGAPPGKLALPALA